MIFKRFLALALLLTLPTLAMQSPAYAPKVRTRGHVVSPKYKVESSQLVLKQEPKSISAKKIWRAKPSELNYDDVVQLIKSIENDELEDLIEDHELPEVIHFLLRLGEQGLNPNDHAAAEVFYQDAEALLNGESIAFEYDTSPVSYEWSPAIYDSTTEMSVEAVGLRKFAKKVAKKTKKACKKVKKFCKKHKEEIFIGLTVVVFAAVATTAIMASMAEATAAASAAETAVGAGSVAGGSLAAEGAAAGAAIGAVGTAVIGSGNQDEEQESIEEVESDSFASDLDTVISDLGDSLGEKVLELKSELHESNLPEDELIEVGREKGAELAHTACQEAMGDDQQAGGHAHSLIDQAFNVISVVKTPIEAGVAASGAFSDPRAKVAAGVIAAGTAVAFPEQTQQVIETIAEVSDGVRDAVLDCGRQVVDQVSDWVNSSDSSCKVVPEPTSYPIPIGHYSIPEDKIRDGLEAGDEPDRGGRTRAGRSIEKHGNRDGSAYPKPFGPPEEINRQGRDMLEEILRDPDAYSEANEIGGSDIVDKQGRVARFDDKGKFIGFREPKN